MEVKESPIDGRGLFATVSYKKGKKIYDYEGTEMKWCDYKGDYRNTYNLKRVHKILVGTSDNPCQYLNTSPDANVILKKRALYALRDIDVGEEMVLKGYFRDYPKLTSVA
jgi:SET domain-containing protein